MDEILEFVKYEGCGNDFILIDELAGTNQFARLSREVARRLCDRHFGVGADGILHVSPSRVADARMRLFDLGVVEAEMCGNGLRCVADYLFRELGRTSLKIETGDGVKEVERMGECYRAHMGRLRYRMRDLRAHFKCDFDDGEPLLQREMSLPGLGDLMCSVVHSGVSHLVIFREDIGSEDIDSLGSRLNEAKEVFPLGINLNLAQVVDEFTMRTRTYERGVFRETLCCGTGATACAAVHLLTKKRPNRRPVQVICRGGQLMIEMDDRDDLWMTGPARQVFRGSIRLEEWA